MVRRAWQAALPNVCSMAIIALLAANYFSPFGDLDYTWQIRTGEIIVCTGDLQPPDHFSYTIPGENLPDFEWLYEVTLWLVWDHLGYGGLKLLKTLLVAATLMLLARRLRVAGMRWHGIAFALTVAALALAPAWNLRPLYCTTLGLLVLSGWLHDHCTGRVEKGSGTFCAKHPSGRSGIRCLTPFRRGKSLTWWLPVLMLVWANCHPAVIAGQALLLGAIGWEWLNRWWKLNTPLDWVALRRLTIVGGLGLVATFLSPDPVERLRYPFKPELAHPIHRVFVEMQPLYSTVTKAPYSSGLIYVVAVLVALSVMVRFRHYRGWEIMLLAGLTFLANTAARAAQDWLLLMLAIGLPHVVALFRHEALTDRRRVWVAWMLRCDNTWKRLWQSPLLRFQRGWTLAAAGLLIFVSVIPALSTRMPVQDAEEWPADAAAFLKGHGLRGNFFAPPDYGAYLTWSLGDDARCYTDTRGFFFPPLLLEDSHYVPQLGPDWRRRLSRILNEFPTDYFVLETTGPRGELWRQLQPVVGSEVIYLDRQCVVLSAESVRRGVQDMEVVQRKVSAIPVK